MHTSDPSPSSPPAAVDTTPFLLHSRRGHYAVPPPPLRTVARFFRRASGRWMRLGEPSVRVRETAAEQLEERQSDWAYSKPVVVLDVLWNLAFLAVGVTVLGLSAKEEKPCVPLRVWIVGYLLQCVLHSLCVVLEFRRRRSSSEFLGGIGEWESAREWSFSSESDYEDYATQFLEGEGNSITKHIKSANTMLSFIWWIVGFYWVIAGGQSFTRDSPQLYWLCITFLAFDVVIVVIRVAVACLIGIAVCCCLPCILAILCAVADQEGATKEEIDQLPKCKFRMTKEFEKEGDIQESSKGIITEGDSDPAAEYVIALEDAVSSQCTK